MTDDAPLPKHMQDAIDYLEELKQQEIIDRDLKLAAVELTLKNLTKKQAAFDVVVNEQKAALETLVAAHALELEDARRAGYEEGYAKASEQIEGDLKSFELGFEMGFKEGKNA